MRSLKQSTWSRIGPLSILFPWWWAFQHHRSSMKSLKELGLAGRKRTIQLWEGLSCPIKSQQVHLKRYLSIIKPGRHQRTLGSWTLQKHLHWRLKRTFSFAGFVKKKKKKKGTFCSFTSISSLLLSTKTKGDFSRSLYQHYLTSSSGFDQITDQIPQDEYWKFVMISTPHSQCCLSVNGKLSVFPVSLFFPLWAKHCCYKNKNSEIPVLTKFGNSHTHEKNLCFSLGNWQSENWQLSFSHIGTYINCRNWIFKWF